MSRLCISILFILSLFWGCNKSNSDIELLQRAEKYWTNSDSISFLIYKIEDSERLSEGHFADYRRLFAIAQMNSVYPMTDDKLFAYPLKYYQKTNNSEKLIQTYKIAGAYWLKFNDYEKAFGYIEKGLQFARHSNDSVEICQFYRFSAEAQKQKKEYSKAIKSLNALVYMLKADDSDLYFDLALCYAYEGQLDSVRISMDKCIDIDVKNNDKKIVVHHLRNYANILYEKGKYAESIVQLKKSLAYSENSILPNLYSSLSLSYLAIENIDSSRYYFEKTESALTAFTKSGNTNFVTYKNIEMALEAILNTKQNKHVSLFELGNFNDSIVSENNNKQQIIEKQLNERNRLETDNLKLKLNEQRTNFLIIILLIVFTVFLFGIISYIRKRARRFFEIEEKSETLQLLLDKALKEQSKEGIDDNFFKKILLQQLGIIRLIATNPTSQNQELLQQITRISTEDVNVESLLVWDDLYPIIDSIYNGFYSKTNTLFGNILIDREVQLCCLLCAEFSTKEISVVTQQSVRTIYQRKTNIRQKLSMNEKGDIVKFLKEI